MTTTNLSDLDFLLGAWRLTTASDTYETWRRLDTTTFIGQSYAMRHGGKHLRETLRLEQQGEDLVYIAQVAHNPAPVRFKLLLQDETRFVFENLEHDFPQRIEYTRRGEDGLVARIEGPDARGGTRGIQYPFTRSPAALRPFQPPDLAFFFEQQLDPQANHLAAFTALDPADRQVFDLKWQKILADPDITLRTIVWGGLVAGYVTCHSWFGEPEIAYWLGREFWGQGIASQALAAFLKEVPTRPLHARAAKDNFASLGVLQKNGFIVHGEDRGHANARQEMVEEYLLRLD